MSSDRSTIESVMGRSRLTKRQDLVYLAEVAATSQRIVLHTNSSLKVPQIEVKSILEQFKTSQVKVDPSKEGGLPEEIFEVVMESMPVCGIMDSDGVPLHPPSVNNMKGRVCVNRQMGGQPGLPMGLADMAEVLGVDVLHTKNVYTGGTWEGFCTRLRQQMGRKTVPLSVTLGDGKPLTRKRLFKILDQYMPRETNPDWPGVHGDFYDGLTTKLKITANASAGAPYWRNKGECMDEILDVGLPIVLEHIKQGTLDKLYRENPEMFLCEVKNKLDRYEKSKLGEKTRPYVCVPAHWAFLFSMVTQGFQETLLVFDQTQKQCSNAYGFSSSKGGLKRMVNWMLTADKRGKVVCYGDDACIVVKRGGKIWRIDPDFKQMDGSLDAEDIGLTVDWMIKHLEQDLGDTSQFWRSVGEVWKVMATNPEFIVNGQTIYRKRSQNGLMTGVPGTTLFDTVKSVLAWNRLLDVCDSGVGDILDEQFVTSWMKQQGLVVKPGTWSPAVVPELIPETLVTDHKFLGVQIKCISYKNTLQFVPTIPYEDAVEMLVVQKDNPFSRKISRTAAARTLYDRMRGLMITMGFTHPGILEAIHNVVNHLPPEIILMDVQIEGGQKPDHITLQDFCYPDSTGFPSYDFCVSVYSDLDEETPGWIQIYPMLMDKLAELKRNRRSLNKEYRFAVADGASCKVIKLDPLPEKPIPKEYELVEAQERTTLAKDQTPNTRSKIHQYRDDKYVEEKRLPTLGEAVGRFLEAIGQVSQVATVCDRFGVNSHILLQESQKYGFYMTGVTGGDLISLYPIATPFASVQETLAQEFLPNTTVGVGTQQRQKARERASKILKTAPELVLLDCSALSGLPEYSHEVENDEQALVALHWMVHKVFGFVKWSSQVDPQRENSVGAFLRVCNPGTEMVVVAEAWSTSKRLAQGYIARAILELNDVPIKESIFSTPSEPAPKGEGNWANETEYELDPRRQPNVMDVNIKTPQAYNKFIVQMAKEYGLTERRVYLAHLINQSSPTPGEEGLRLLLSKMRRRDQELRDELPFRAANESPPHSPPSKRSKMSAERKTQLNRKMHERRKKRRSAPQP